ncbi:Ig-like domain-containing protein [Fodinicurvata sp. EGI_FJ10296]|uniref:Ig-like domain-containing protein n=1 Tax=Fodinicurvata sp. EGI_FJ10296 TaxID=3231908 RepID=UPI0034540C50
MPAFSRLRAALVAGAVGVTTTASAQDRCEPVPVDPWPTCSAAMMAQAINPPFTFESVGDVNLDAFADGANAELLPGRARLQVSHASGGVAGSGIACASHLGAVAAEGGASGISPEMAAQMELYTGEEFEGTESAGTVFRVFSPNLNVWRGGGMAGPLEVRHGGVGGWPANAAAQVVVELAGTPPSEIEAGQSYAARAYVSGDGRAQTVGGFITSWNGVIGRVSDPMDPEYRRACERSMARMRDMLEAVGVPFENAMGRAYRSYECESHLRLVDGVSRRVTQGSLSGEVVIEAVTANRVVGSFDLSGPATVAISTHRPERLTETEERSGPMTITGRFMAPNVRTTGMAGPHRAARVDGNDPEPGAGFTVAAQTPEPDRRNVSWTPDIRLRFSEPVDPDSLNADAITLSTRNAGGDMERVEASLALAAPDEVAVVTADRLRDGVRYRLTARPSGVRSASGAALSSAHTSDFYTMVNLNDDEDMIYTAPGSSTRFTPHQHFVQDWTEGIETNLYQVSANEPLIVGKPTAARVYMKWRPHDDVHEDWQVEEFRTHVRGIGDEEQPLFDEVRGARVRRLDLYDAEDRRAAHNSVNLYGWTPAEVDETFEVRIEVEPVDQCGEPEVFVEDADVEWNDLQTELTIAYYMARVGPWRDGVPGWALNEARRVARTAADFTTQTFPVTDTNLRFAGAMHYAPADHQEMQDEVARGNAGGVRNYLMASTHDRLAAARQTDADVWLLFTPFSWLEVAGRAEWDLGADYDALHATDDDIRFAFPTIQMTITKGMGDTPLTSAMQLVTHELGHIYGLDHEPYARDTEHRRAVCDAAAGDLYPGIEGFRIERDGYPGFNKSSIEGNAQSGEQLLPLMLPCGGAVAEYWITREHYTQLIDNMTQIGSRSSP